MILDADSKIREVRDIGKIVSAELPDPNANPRLYETVRSTMVHGPCGLLNPASPCMVDGVCSKNFPKPFAPETLENVNGYPIYQRRDNGSFVMIREVKVDNRWIVPHNPWLSSKFNAHINVEICSSVRSVKYLFKYLYKGYDSANVQMRQPYQRENEGGVLVWDEINTFLDTRYVSPPKAMWRLNENEMHKQSHTIIRLAVHLPLQQTVVFREGDEVAALERAQSSDTTLTSYFKLNTESAEAREYLYHDIPNHFVWDAGRKR